MAKVLLMIYLDRLSLSSPPLDVTVHNWQRLVFTLMRLAAKEHSAHSEIETGSKATAHRMHTSKTGFKFSTPMRSCKDCEEHLHLQLEPELYSKEEILAFNEVILGRLRYLPVSRKDAAAVLDLLGFPTLHVEDLKLSF